MSRRVSLLTILSLCTALSLQGCEEGGRSAAISNLPATPPDDTWFQEMVVDNPKLVVVDFYADWCGPCRQLSPLLEKLQSEYADQMAVVKVNVDEREVIAAHYNVSSIPMVLIMYQGKVLDGTIGLPRYEALEQMVKPHLSVVQSEVAKN